MRTLTFEATADMLILILEDGSDEGREFARGELRRWGVMLDDLAALNAARDLATAG